MALPKCNAKYSKAPKLLSKGFDEYLTCVCQIVLDSKNRYSFKKTDKYLF